MFTKCILGLLSLAILVADVFAIRVEPSGTIPKHTLVRVFLEEGERAWIISSKFEPVDTESIPGKIIWTGPPGRYAILSWTETSQSQMIVTIEGTEPGPDPDPNPDPDPDPNPNPGPIPATVKNEYGIGGPVYLEAKKLNRPEEAKQLGQVARLILKALLEGRVTPVGAEATLKKQREQLQGDWSRWEAAVEKALAAAIQKHGAGALVYRDYFLEIATGLEAVGGGTARAR